MKNKLISLDIREDIRNGREPFAKIMTAAAALQANEQLRLIAPFEPVPVFRVLAQQGFQHHAQAMESGDWEVVFTRDLQSAEPPAPRPSTGNPAEAAEPKSQNRASSAGAQVIEVDARGLEPPQPMVKILETLAALPVGAALHARTDRRPMHLYAQLAARGFAGATEEQGDGSFLTRICQA